jgi:hypothetical protein
MRNNPAWLFDVHGGTNAVAWTEKSGAFTLLLFRNNLILGTLACLLTYIAQKRRSVV